MLLPIAAPELFPRSSHSLAGSFQSCFHTVLDTQASILARKPGVSSGPLSFRLSQLLRIPTLCTPFHSHHCGSSPAPGCLPCPWRTNPWATPAHPGALVSCPSSVLSACLMPAIHTNQLDLYGHSCLHTLMQPCAYSPEGNAWLGACSPSLVAEWCFVSLLLRPLLSSTVIMPWTILISPR